MTEEHEPQLWPAVVRMWLDEQEATLRRELTNDHRTLRIALNHIAFARRELARYPAGAELAFNVASVQFLAVKPSLVVALSIERQRRHAGKASARKKTLTAAAVCAAFEDLKRQNPDLSNKAVARRYLKDNDPDWSTAQDADRDRKVTNLLRCIARVKKNLRR